MATTPTIPMPDVNAQAKAALPQPELKPVWEEEPRVDTPPTSKLGQAYAHAKDWLSTHEQHLSEKYLAPFRQGLDNMATDLEQAGESGHTKTGGQLSPLSRSLVEGAGTMLRWTPVADDVKSTLMANIVPPELGPEGKLLGKLNPKSIIEDAGFKYKGELSPGTGVHQFEHPDHPGRTASIRESAITSEAVKLKMDSKIKEFETGEKTNKLDFSSIEGHIQHTGEVPRPAAQELSDIKEKTGLPLTDAAAARRIKDRAPEATTAKSAVGTSKEVGPEPSKAEIDDIRKKTGLPLTDNAVAKRIRQRAADDKLSGVKPISLGVKDTQKSTTKPETAADRARRKLGVVDRTDKKFTDRWAHPVRSEPVKKA